MPHLSHPFHLRRALCLFAHTTTTFHAEFSVFNSIIPVRKWHTVRYKLHCSRLANISTQLLFFLTSAVSSGYRSRSCSFGYRGAPEIPRYHCHHQAKETMSLEPLLYALLHILGFDWNPVRTNAGTSRLRTWNPFISYASEHSCALSLFAECDVYAT